MANEWKKLIRILEEEAELHGALIASAAEKRRMIVENDIAGVEALGMTEERFTERLRAADKERERISSRLAVDLGMDPSETRLEKLCSRAAEPERSRLRSVGARLRNLVSEFSDINAEITELLVHAMAHVDSFFKLIADSLTQRPTYAPRPATERAPAASVLDHKA